MATLNGFDIETGQRIWSDNDTAMQDAFWGDVRASQVWKRYRDHYGADAQNNAIVYRVLDKLYGHAEHVTTGMYLDALKTSMDGGEVLPLPKESEPTTAPTSERPRDSQGRFQSQDDVFAAWANAPGRSMQEVRQRASADRPFGDWFRRIAREQTIKEGPFRLLGGASRSAEVDLNSSLAEFARLYRLTPTQSMKPINGIVTLGGIRYTVAEFSERVNKAAQTGLL